MRKSLLILSLTLLAVAASAGDAFAQRWGGYRGWGGGYSGRYNYYPRTYYGYGSGYYNPSYRGQYYNWGYTPSYYYSAPQYLVEPSYDTYSNSAPITQSYYSGPGTSVQPVTVSVLVPVPDAQVWFENSPTQQQGTERVFQSAPLQTGSTYVYAVKARWNENGRPIEQERQVNVQAGQSVSVDFRSNPGATIPLPRTAPREEG